MLQLLSLRVDSSISKYQQFVEHQFLALDLNYTGQATSMRVDCIISKGKQVRGG